ncbi:hypothetical protein PHLGIDRAFT_214018 [Phlebiopsis gigantea 11061_1 CR5-6]|uniref:RRM domain-containing protein n=1 Tax=Phlebiopsis gigantea (strain 11061_1 CR5-6) TaxID=745531 RepID=A0A0C3S2S5_PHLG1|nr:hypothetical protein PHLGIDRAFT_214018 [Phlebiopsis gigantea 11061_1 CR5-6]
MAEGRQHAPHPLVTNPTLWAVDIPAHLKWLQLLELLKACGEVRSGGRGMTPDGRSRWAITFSDIYHAEMALATLNGLPVPNLDPPWNLVLSHSSSLESALPKEPLCAQFAKSPANTHPLSDASAQDVFRWFRPAGPLVTARADVDVGYPKRTCVIQYWDETHASSAFKCPQGLHPALTSMPMFNLRTFAQCSVFVTNLGPNFRLPDVDTVFGLCGTIIHTQVMKPGTTNCQCSVSFSKQEEGVTLSSPCINVILFADRSSSICSDNQAEWHDTTAAQNPRPQFRTRAPN